MPRKKAAKARRFRCGKVSIYQHHGAWYVYYREGDRPQRIRVGTELEAARQVAADINAKVSSGLRSPFSFEPITIEKLREKVLDHHENIERSSLATLKRYGSATKHLADFAGSKQAHRVDAEEFLRYLRKARVTPNGHANTAKRALRDKGIQFILETCRSMYKFAGRKRHLPPYEGNPFDSVRIHKSKIFDRQPIETFDSETEGGFFQTVDLVQLPFFAVLAKTGARTGELRHAMIEDLDLNAGWWHVRNKPALWWWIKTRRERTIPLSPELVVILKHVIGERSRGLVFWYAYRQGRPKHAECDTRQLHIIAAHRLRSREIEADRQLTRREEAAELAKVWREAGIVRHETIRIAMLRTTAAFGRPSMTCPKSWRHTFAGMLQEANVDPLIREITLGHMPVAAENSALGMTGVYTHTLPELQHREILRALGLRKNSLTLVLARLGLKRNAQSESMVDEPYHGFKSQSWIVAS